MPHDWIKDVLTDLRDFARLNDMPDLALHLDGALTVAGHEIARTRGASGAGGTARAFAGQGVDEP
ncbi:MAG: hypothetical protein KDE00_10130 [Rhodobacteraceae bacterium]|nr:hypothetical protein [Paracoccaceae bacterium]